jgi:hypothetical protein
MSTPQRQKPKGEPVNMPDDRDADSERLARIEHMLKGLCATSEHLHDLAVLAQARAGSRITKTKAITDRFAQSRRTKVGKKRKGEPPIS